jgi:AcrR family transcriptional regulator
MEMAEENPKDSAPEAGNPRKEQQLETTRLKSVGKQAARRRAAEARILDAFERVLLQRGASGLRINAIAAEAETAKGLIYYYFNSLDGLATAWMERSKLAPSREDIAGENLDDFARRDKQDRLARIHVNYASMLRDRPAACEILAASLQSGQHLPGLLELVRQRLGKAHEELLTTDQELMNDDDMAMIFVLQAASNYLALRAQSAPNYNGVQLDTAEGWELTMQMLRRVAGVKPEN